MIENDQETCFFFLASSEFYGRPHGTIRRAVFGPRAASLTPLYNIQYLVLKVTCYLEREEKCTRLPTDITHTFEDLLRALCVELEKYTFTRCKYMYEMNVGATQKHV